jgi:hypothetical protein
MTAGTGIRHSEYNASKKDPLRLIQLWILPEKSRLEPSWEQKQFSNAARNGKLLPIAVPVHRDAASVNGAVRIHQDATIYTSLLHPGKTTSLTLEAGRRAYLFLMDGELKLKSKNGRASEPPVTLSAGDQARITETSALEFTGGKTTADFLLLDLP